jgi:magnesium chelatase family protein
VINVPRLTTEELINTTTEAEPSAVIRERVIKARKLQANRYKEEGILTNSELTAEMIKKYCKLDDASEQIMKLAAQKYQLSGRRYHRVLKIARTIADLAGAENIESTHLTQALQYRSDI